MIALPFHPSNAYTIQEFLANAAGNSRRAWRPTPGGASPRPMLHLTDKIHDGGVWADQGVIAGCAGGLFDNIAEAADILRGDIYRVNGAFTFDVYPTSVPVSLELTRSWVPRRPCWSPAPLSSPASAAPASVREMYPPTTACLCATPPGTSPTGRAASPERGSLPACA